MAGDGTTDPDPVWALDPQVRPGPTNSIVDVPGIRVGQHDRRGDGWLTGTTVVLAPPEGAVGGVDVRGGGPGTRETDLLDPLNQVDRVHAVVLSGGSAFGLAAADGVMRHLYDEGTGFPAGPEPGQVVPIVPAAVIFDLGRGGDFAATPDASFGAAAAAAASGDAPELGCVGAGTGAECGGLKGGVGSASAVLPDGTTVAALVVANPGGHVLDLRTGELVGARALLEGDLDVLGERTAYGLRRPDPAELEAARARAARIEPAGLVPKVLATTIGVIATDATLTKAQATKVAGIGHDGMARAIDPVHTMFDGDTLFTVATGTRPAPDPIAFHGLLTVAARTVTRAIVRAVLAAEGCQTQAGTWRSYTEAFPSAVTTD
ncbi:P1 family peptidase [Ornithinimicrobium sp. F0845]|uniref:P1 family peptidase n=1 Tax=Ornithinimicrobium sp. F0845 TaxID=2926412 RepID=UPI001FF58CA4|nr:P1 family peptidase [Ornithinimicrobium sp. F0845]MCK0112071.1 P1 family peptidase [Ornithinimicrobium sp. F0845]